MSKKQETKPVKKVTQKLEELKISDEEQRIMDQNKHEMFQMELGFSIVVEEMIKAFQANPSVALIGHNMIYDIIYLYNQFIAPLPKTYEEFVKEWFHRFPCTFDTKVLAYRADYFGKTILGNIYEKC